MNYAEDLANRILPGLPSEKDVLSAAYILACDELGHRKASHYFSYDQDFLADLVGAYYSKRIVDQKHQNQSISVD